MITQKQLERQRQFIKDAAFTLGCLRLNGSVDQKRFAAITGLTEETVNSILCGHVEIGNLTEARILGVILTTHSIMIEKG